MVLEWFCRYCGFRDKLFSKYYWKCPRCGKPLEIVFNKSFNPRGRGLARYSSMLPFTPEKTRGEGNTPLIVEENGSHKLLFKLEYFNPSGSFKDRGSALSIYYAYKMKYKDVVEDTSGNTGISVTLYSKLYGLEPHIIMPVNAPLGKKVLIESLGGRVIEARDRSEAAKLVLNYVNNKYYVAHTWSYFYILGASTISYEVYEEYGVPDYVIVPIGSGGLFLGLVKGFENLRDLNLIDKIPVFIGVQGYSVQPVYKLFKGSEVKGEDSSLADGIMVAEPPRLEEIVEVLRRYRGEVVLVGNSEIAKALEKLYDKGYIVEPTSATPYAAYMKIRDKLGKGSVLIPLTGSGLKMRNTIHESLTRNKKAHGP